MPSSVPRLMVRRRPGLADRSGVHPTGVAIALLLTLAACQAQAAPSASIGASSGLASTAIPVATPVATPAPGASTLGAHVAAQWTVTNPSFLAFGFGSVWVTNHYGNNITRIDPVSNTVQTVIQGTGSNPEQALAVGNALWVTGQRDDMKLIDPTTNTITRTIAGDHLFEASGFNSVWVTTRDNRLERFDPATATITASIAVGVGEDDCMNDVVATAAAVWVISCDTGTLLKVDPIRNSVVSRIPYATLIAEATTGTRVPAGKGSDSIWITVAGDEGAGTLPSGLLRVDPIAGAGSAFLPLTPAHNGDGFNAVTDDAVWIAGSQEVNRVDVASNRIVLTFPTAPGRLKIGVAFGSVWLRNFEQSLIQRLDFQP